MSSVNSDLTIPLHSAESNVDSELQRQKQSRNTAGFSKSSLFMRWNLYDDLSFIVESSWFSPTTFLYWKAFAWAWTSCIWWFTCFRFGPRFLIFLTNWNHTAHYLYFNCSFYLCLRAHLARNKKAATSSIEDGLINPTADTDAVATTSYKPHPTFLHFTFGLMEHAFAWTCLVVVVYWSTEFPNWVKTDPDATDKFVNACIHGVTFVLITTDLILNRVEFVWPHFLYTMTISMIYLAVNGIYCKIAGGFIYQVLKWNNFLTLGAIIGCTLFVLGMYGVGHLICMWRNKRTGHTSPEEGLKFFVLRR